MFGIATQIKLILLLCLFSYISKAQTDNYNKFNWELEFTRHVKDKWAMESVISRTRTSKPNESNMFEFSSRFGFELWGLYYLNSKWQLSVQLAYFANQRVPELNQEGSREFRISQQAIYFINKVRFNLAYRSRIETRLEQDENKAYRPIFHLRQRIQLMYPFNGKVVRRGIFYGLLTEEISVKTNSDVKGKEFFDRNTFRVGTGYAVTDNLRVELIYVNELIPRSSVNQKIHTMQVRLALNNFLPGLVSYYNSKIKRSDQEIIE